MRRTTILATLVASCLVLALAPTLAMGKTFKYTGPVDLVDREDPLGFPHPAPAIQLKVSFQGKTPKLVPAGTLKEEGVYGYCVDHGGTTGVGPYYFGERFGDDLRINKKKRFAGTFSSTEDPDFPKDEGVFFRVTGKVHKRTVTGTVRTWINIPANNDPVFHQEATECDTGVLNYTASR